METSSLPIAPQIVWIVVFFLSDVGACRVTLIMSIPQYFAQGRICAWCTKQAMGVCVSKPSPASQPYNPVLWIEPSAPSTYILPTYYTGASQHLPANIHVAEHLMIPATQHGVHALLMIGDVIVALVRKPMPPSRRALTYYRWRPMVGGIPLRALWLTQVKLILFEDCSTGMRLGVGAAPPNTRGDLAGRDVYGQVYCIEHGTIKRVGNEVPPLYNASETGAPPPYEAI
jgi:hypothetical protein